MNRSLFVVLIILTSLLMLFDSGCQPTNNSTPKSQPADTASQPSTPPAQPEADNQTVQMPITLPVLDAFFSDDKFAGELKQKLNLTGEQVQKLKQTAREETAKLNESDNQTGTAEAARDEATQKITAIIGPEKEKQLVDFVNSQWSGGSQAELSTTPNAIPTDTRIVVNAPAYRMDVYNNGQLLKTYVVSIGYPEFPLPTGLRLAREIIFNPVWTPPDEPWVRASTKYQAGEKVEAGSKLNPLGPIKIPIGLPSLIPGGKPLAKIGGLGSHGCAGLTSPQVNDFAFLLAHISNTPLNNGQEAAYESTPSQTKKVDLKTPIPVELRYETIVVQNGKLHIYRDVYEHNTNTEDNLRNVLKVYGITLEQLSQDERDQISNALNQMARGASGSPADQSQDQSDSKNKKSKSAKVTPRVIGQKEIVIDIAELQGKGYPDPVNLSTGNENNKAIVATNKATNKKRGR